MKPRAAHGTGAGSAAAALGQIDDLKFFHAALDASTVRRGGVRAVETLRFPE
ncbi:hypothetical protein WME99_08345 [Sorangium sp. So ce136]|uniref:hypothetical protein n=1 Tax=Sorangium sp. So ce136 TaxID=3133284 RepID=UPI003F117F7F